jgi:hypothetical protein
MLSSKIKSSYFNFHSPLKFVPACQLDTIQETASSHVVPKSNPKRKYMSTTFGPTMIDFHEKKTKYDKEGNEENEVEKTLEQKVKEQQIKKQKLQEQKEFLNKTMRGELVNMYEKYPDKPEDKVKQPPAAEILKMNLPVRGIIAGKSGSGKTNFLLNLIKSFNCFDEIWLFAKDTNEQLYQHFIEEIKKQEQQLGKTILHVCNNIDQIPKISELNERLRKEKKHALVIVDDMINEGAKKLAGLCDIYTLGRKGNISPWFLTQDWFKSPFTIRKNLSDLVLGQLCNVDDCKRIVNRIPQVCMTADRLYALHDKIVGDKSVSPPNLLSIRLDADEPGLMFRKNLAPYSVFPKGLTFEQMKQNLNVGH